MGAGGAVPKASAGWAPQQPRESKASKIYDGASEEVLFFFFKCDTEIPIIKMLERNRVKANQFRLNQ